MPPRLTDVAQRARVSTATVSRVLNGKPGIARTTRDAVMEAVNALGYQLPERLRERPVGLVGLVVPELMNPVFPAFADAVEHALTEQGYTMLLCTEAVGRLPEETYIATLADLDVAGIIFVSGMHADVTSPTDRYDYLRARGVPIVLVNGYRAEVDAQFISCDDRAAVRLAVHHLAALGHRKIGLVSGPVQLVPARRKLDAFHEVVTEVAGIEASHVATNLYTLEGGQAATAELLAQGSTGIVCGSDLMALGAVRAAQAAGLQVPRDVSVIGFDDSILLPFTHPPLTTVRQPTIAMARSAVAVLLAEIGGTEGSRTELLFAPELVVRGSAGPAPG